MVDVICHGAPSPLVWSSYLKNIGGNITYVNFREKSRGWHNYRMRVEKDGKTAVNDSKDMNPYMKSFLSDENLRQSCYACNFKHGHYAADITLGDAWKIEKVYPKWADNKGTGLIITRSDTGRNLIDSIKDRVNIRETDYDLWKKYNPSLEYATQCPNGRSAFWKKFLNSDCASFWKEYGKNPAKKQVRYYAKTFLRTTGLEKVIRKFI